MKAEAQLRKPLHCLNLPLMCEQQLQHEVHQRCRGKGEGTPDTTVAAMATKKLDDQLSNHSQLYSLCFPVQARQQVFITPKWFGPHPSNLTESYCN